MVIELVIQMINILKDIYIIIKLIYLKNVIALVIFALHFHQIILITNAYLVQMVILLPIKILEIAINLMIQIL